MSKSNHSKSENFFLSGPIWISKEFISINNTIDKNNKKNIISLFTTSFSGFNAVNSIESHENFLLFALDVVTKNPKFTIIFKSKKDFGLYETHEQTKELTKKLLSHNNFEVIDNKFFSPNIFKASDIVISMPFASTGLEAICLGKKSFYVDLLNTYKNSYFDNFEKIVSHSKEDALNNLNYWINADQNEVMRKRKEILKKMGIENVGKASEIIRDKIIMKINSYYSM